MNHETPKLSLFATIFLNINIMLGTGVFINTVVLTQKVGVLAPLLYALSGLLMLPLILSFARLMQLYKEGSFYNFGASITPYLGFISTWSYFIGKLATPTLGIHVFNLFLQKTVPYFAQFSVFMLDVCIITLFVGLNLFSGTVGKKIQYFFLITKSMPLLFALGAGLWCFDIINIAAPSVIWQGIPLSLPLVIFCFLGFEATCSLSKIIQDPQKNASKAIIYSFFIVMALLTLYQFLFYGSLGESLAEQQNYVTAFPLLIQKACPQLVSLLAPLLSLAIATSALGGAYGLLYSNAWNLHILAQKKYIPFYETFARCNIFHIPYACILFEGIMCFCYLALTQGSQIPLQYTSVLSCMATHAISAISLVILEPSLLSFLGLTSSIIAIIFCVRGFIFTNLIPLYFFLGILALGTLIYLFKRNKEIT